MRGIAGLIHFDGSPVRAETVRGMIDTMAICPTDRRQAWAHGAAGLAHLVKFGVPEDQFEAQPIVDPAGRFVLVTDAMLTNRVELAEALGQRPIAAEVCADSALVAAAYAQWGEDCVERLEGRFAVIAWHPHERRLFAAVDPFAHRPVYYWHRGGQFAFASTLRGLLALPVVSAEINPSVFAEGFTGMWQANDQTLYRDISIVPRGCILRVDAHGRAVRRYWHPQNAPELRLRSDGEYLEAFRTVLVRAIQGTLRTTGETGVLVSGGLDSSAVTAVAGQFLARNGQRLHAFHRVPAGKVPYVGELREHDESSYVRDLQRHAPHIDFHFFPQSPPALLSEAEQAQRFADEQAPSHGLPLGPDPAWENLIRERNVHLMLNGLGGNELVSLQIRRSNYLGYLGAGGRWLTLAAEIRGLHRVYGTPWRVLLREAVHGSGWVHVQPLPMPARLRMLRPEVLAHTGLAERWHEAHANFSRHTARDWRGALAHGLTEMMVQNAGVSASVISRHSLFESSAPMFDRRLNEFCLAVPPGQQFRHGWDRRLLREVSRELLPERVRLRVTRGFPQPFALQAFSRHRGEIIARLERVLGEPVVADYFDVSAVRELTSRAASPSSSAQDQHTASSLLTWAEFLAWRTNASKTPLTPEDL